VPIRDPETGKPLSGSALNRLRKAKVEAERTRDIEEQTGLTLEPPPSSTAELVTWAAAALAQAIYRASQDRKIFLTEADQLRYVADGCAKLGMVRDKAAEQERIKRVAERTGLTQDRNKPAAGAKSLAGIAKPETARRA
jgi:hypothetical protein